VSDGLTTWDLLRRLLVLDSPSGDEGAIADWLMDYAATQWPDTRRERLGDSVLIVRGERPATALFAHTDTTGFTLGYEKALIPLGSPDPKRREALRPVGGPDGGNRLKRRQNGDWVLMGETEQKPGSRWIYATQPVRDGDMVTSPYLDNRGGVCAALMALGRCPNIAVAFTVGEEHSGHGAFVCARWLYKQYGIIQALISDITWDTAHIHCGKGVAVSLRDRTVPRQRFLDQILALAELSAIPFQREIESSGGSDGGSIERSGVPMDWVFVGAPEKKPHTSAERLDLRDLESMIDMLVFLVDALHAQSLKDKDSD
jgi:putative aminopeptidase FrvX